MKNLYEKTNTLVGKLDVNNVGGNIKVRLGRAESNPDFLFFSQDRKLLESIARGAEKISGRKPQVWHLENVDNYHLVLTHNYTKELCDKLKINFDAIKSELQQNHAFVDNLQLEPSEALKKRYLGKSL